MTGTLPVAGSTRRRIVVAAALITALGVATLLMLGGLVAARFAERDTAATLHDRAAAVATTVQWDAAAGRLRTTEANEQFFDATSWIYTAEGTKLEGPSVAAPVQAVLTRLSRVPVTTTAEAAGVQFRADPITTGRPARRMGAIVVAVDQRASLVTLDHAGIAAAVLAALMVAGVAGLAYLIVGRALRPVAVMTARAEQWSHDRLEHRFALGPPRDEITGLASVLDRLLERVGRSIRAEQRLTAELAHEFRTPLTVIQGEAELGSVLALSARSRDRFARIAEAATEMSGAMQTLLDVARGEVTTGDSTVIAPVLATLTSRIPTGGVQVHLAEMSPLPMAVPQDLLTRILAPLIDNAARHARTEVRIRAAVKDHRMRIEVGNDGPSIPDALVADLFTAGVRDGGSAGAGLGLALSRRLAEAAGGTVSLASADPVRFTVVLPVAVEEEPAG